MNRTTDFLMAGALLLCAGVLLYHHAHDLMMLVGTGAIKLIGMAGSWS